MSRHTRRSLSLPARMAAAGVDRVFVAEATTLALGYGSQRLTNSRLWSDNMALRTRAEKAEAERDRLRAALIDHNDLLRSAMQICNRAIQHEEFRVLANWDAFHDRTSVCLKRHHATSNDARAALKGTSE